MIPSMHMNMSSKFGPCTARLQNTGKSTTKIKKQSVVIFTTHISLLSL